MTFLSGLPRLTHRQTTDLESPHKTKTSRDKRRMQTLTETFGRTIRTYITEQTSDLQDDYSTDMGLWTRAMGATKKTNLNRIQSLQSKILRKIVDAPYYVSNLIIHKYLKIPFVYDLVRSRYKKFHPSIAHHPNPLVQTTFLRILLAASEDVGPGTSQCSELCELQVMSGATGQLPHLINQWF